jgi:hypothetical protein
MNQRLVVLAAVAGLLSAVGCTTQPADDSEESSVASPLKTQDHYAITVQNCLQWGFSMGFCARVGSEAFNVDAQEWDNLTAHAMPYWTQSQCDAVAAVQGRLRSLGTDARAVLAKPVWTGSDADRLASDLGRALHTIQDNCAHEGMTNPQHAWYSINGYCLSDGEDPDTAPAALQCASGETRAIFYTLAYAVRTFGHQLEGLVPDSGLGTVDPSRAQVCSFLAQWSDFDGYDRRWDNGVVANTFRDTMIHALTDGANVPNACDGLPTVAGHSPIAVRSPRWPVSVSDPMCFTQKVYCFGE